jgi:xanthine dehydrogenase molybdenum-binding subunit
MDYKLIGHDFVPPDVDAKVRGKARYTEDMRAEGMLHCKLLTSPMPHARVRRIHAAAALAMPGVVAILTADDVPSFNPPQAPILSNEPLYIGAPILAVAAVDELTAIAAVEAIKLDLEPLPFVLDPLESLRPGGPSARRDGNVGNLAVPVQTIKWKESDFAGLAQGRLPMGTPAKSWSYGDLDAGFRDAKLIIEESFVTGGVAHHCLETRSALAYWQNGKCILYGSTQGHTFEMPILAGFIGIDVDDLVFVSEFCGGGFGSKAVAYTLMAIPAHMARKTNRPVMMRISRDEEYAACARSGLQAYVKMGFRADGRITAIDLYVVQDEGPFDAFIDFIHAGEAVSAVYQPLAMRWQGIPVFTNSPPRTPFRGPGTNSMAAMVDPHLDRAAKALGLDRLAIRRINAPDGMNGTNGKINGDRQPMSSAFLKEALDQGAALFKWDERIKRNGQRKGSKITAVGVGQAYHGCGYNGYDGLVRITPDGKLHVHTGVGNLGTYSYASTSRAAAEVLNCSWENTIIERGDSRRGLPWNLTQDSSNTSFTMARTNYAAAMDAKQKLCEIAAAALGGSAADYDLGQERVVHRRDASRGLTFAQAAQRAIQMGGRYSGHEVPVDIHTITKSAVAKLAGSGLVGVSRDELPLPEVVPTFACTFVEIELDAETGALEIIDIVCVSDCGVVMHPKGLEVQLKSASVQGIGTAHLEHHVFDAHLGIPIHASILDSRPPSFLDVPVNIQTGAVNKADRRNPVGTKGMGEPPMGSSSGALVSAIQEALGGVSFNRLPVTTDMIINALAKRAPAHTPLQVNCV